MAFRQIPYMEAYEIDEYGNVRDSKTHRNVPYTDDMTLVIINGENISVLKLMAQTFIGPSSLKPLQVGQTLEPKYVTYIFDKIERIDDMTFMIDGELFKRIPDYSDFIVNEYGVVWSLIRGVFIHNSVNHNGYLTATVTDDRAFRAPRKVHQLVYAAHVGNLDKSLVIDHHDNVKTHNHYKNLNQITVAENVQKGALHGRFEWSNEDIQKICEGIKAGYDGVKIADMLGMKYDEERIRINHIIHRIKTGKSYRAIAVRYGIGDKAKTLGHKFTDQETKEIINKLSWRVPPSVLAAQYDCLIGDIDSLKRKHQKTIDMKSLGFGAQRLAKAVPETFTSGKK